MKTLAFPIRIPSKFPEKFSRNSNAVCKILSGKIQNMILVFLLFLSFILKAIVLKKGGDFAIYMGFFCETQAKFEF